VTVIYLVASSSIVRSDPPVYVYDPREDVLRSDQHSNARGTDMAEHLPARHCSAPRWQCGRAQDLRAAVGAPGMHVDQRANSQLIGHLLWVFTEIVGGQTFFNLADRTSLPILHECLAGDSLAARSLSGGQAQGPLDGLG
jgi:hypothetical protein